MKKISLFAFIFVVAGLVCTTCDLPPLDSPLPHTNPDDPDYVDPNSDDPAGDASKAITAFVFADPPAIGEIDEENKVISVTVPHGTERNGLTPTITYTGASISPESGVARNFSSPVTYTVTAEDESTAEYTVTVIEAASDAKEITAFAFADPQIAGDIDDENFSITVTVPYSTDVTALVAVFSITGASVKVGDTTQTNGSTANDFSNPVTYTVTAADGTTQDYTVTVRRVATVTFDANDGTPEIQTVEVVYPDETVGPLPDEPTRSGYSFYQWINGSGVTFDGSTVITGDITVYAEWKSSAKEITAFSIGDPPATGVIDPQTLAITVTVPYDTELTDLAPTIGTSEGATINPASGEAQDFTNPVTYIVTAADGSTAEYTVTVDAAASDAKEITAFNFLAAENMSVLTADVTGTISGTDITLTVPYGTNVESLKPTITHTGASISPDPSSAQDFTDPVTYIVTAVDESVQSYTVTVIFESATVTFDATGGTPDYQTEEVIPPATTVSALPSPDPTLTNYTFQGWYTERDGGGTMFTDTTTVTGDITVYAYWVGNQYTVTLNPAGGSGGDPSVQVNYGSPMPSGYTAPTRTGYDFGGYWIGIGGTGDQYYDSSMISVRNWDIASDYDLYAYWIEDPYTVYLDKQEGGGGTDYVYPVYGSSMPSGATAPTRTGYTFGGYYDGTNGGGFQYYDSLMNSTRTWDKDFDTTLYAKWTGNQYTVTLNPAGGSGGTGSVQAEYGSPMPAATAPTKSGNIFDGYYIESGGGSTQYYDADMNSVQNWNISSDYTLYANWVPSVVGICAGSDHSMFIRSDGSLWTCGDNYYGQLGNGGGSDSYTPVQIRSGSTASVSGGNHTMILDDGGNLYGTGLNGSGQIGDGTTTNKTSPVQISSVGSGVASVSATHGNFSMIRKNGSLLASGSNNYGQLGLGDTTNKLTPTTVSSPTNVVAVSNGAYHSAAVRNDGTLFTTGRNYFGQLGTDNTNDRSSFNAITTISGVETVSCGWEFTMALKGDGTLWACGANYNGQLGTGNTTSTQTFTQVMTGVDVVSTGQGHTMVLKTDGSLWACGWNNYGQLGIGNTTQQTSFVQVLSGGVVAVSAGMTHTLIIKDDGTLWAFGDNSNGQLGDGTTNNRLSPVQIVP